jgi:hypothetical protein
VDFGELNDKAIKGLMNLSKIVSRFYLYSHAQQAYGARLHVFNGREHNNECTHYGSNLEACTSVVNQDQAFEAGFSNEG